MNLTDTLETVLKANIVNIASSNYYLRQLLAREINKDEIAAKQVLAQIEESIKTDIETAKQHVPSFLQHLAVPAEVEAGLRELHLAALCAAVKTDSETMLTNLAKHFVSVEQEVKTVLHLVQDEPTVQQETADIEAPPAPPLPPPVEEQQ